MKKLFFTLLTLFITVATTTLAQTMDEIKADSKYVWGYGEAKNQKEAKEKALHDLSSNISTHVSSVDKMYISNEEKNHDVKTYVSFEQKMSTYSAITLTGCHTKVLSSSNPCKVFVYIENEKVDRIFANRIKLMQENTRIANEAYQSLNLADALRYYYISYLMVQSLRYRAEAKVEDETGKDQMAMTWIRRRIEDILSSVKVTVRERNGDNSYVLGFMYKDKPVQKIGYTYWDGDEFQERISYAQDGLGMVNLDPSFAVDNVKVRIEYKYENLVNHNDAETSSIYDALAADVNFNGTCGASIKQSNIGDFTQTYEGQLVGRMTKSQDKIINELSRIKPEDNPLGADAAKKYAEILARFVDAVKNSKYDVARSLCSAYGADAFDKLIKYGEARLVGTPNVTFTEYNGHIYARSIPMQFSFSGGNKFMENVVITMTTDGVIDNIAFGLSYKAAEDLFCNMADKAQASARSAISNFLENYRTAYALGRFDYLDMVFSDDALIITGKEVKKLVGNKETGFHTERQVVKTRQSKQEFLDNLKRAFDSKEYVNIQFVNNQVQPSRRSINNGRDVYGIAIRQDYFSNNYKDQGYLFLRVDVTNPDEPIVSVRVWQEMPDNEEGLANIANWQNFFESYDK